MFCELGHSQTRRVGIAIQRSFMNLYVNRNFSKESDHSSTNQRTLTLLGPSSSYGMPVNICITYLAVSCLKNCQKY